MGWNRSGARPPGPGERNFPRTTSTTPRIAASLSNNNITSILEDRLGNLWIGTAAGLNKLDRATGRFLRFLHDPANPRSLGHDYVSSIWEDQSGVLWVGAMVGSGLSALDVKTGRIHPLFLSLGAAGKAERSPG